MTTSPGDPKKSTLKRLAKLFAVKPLTMIYGLQYAITGPVSSQLWLDRTCLVNLNVSSEICGNLSFYNQTEDIVQKKVTEFNIIGSYIENIPAILITLYLGPMSDHGRKLLMYLPFIGHIFSGGFFLFFLYYDTLPAQWLWFSSIYILFGGYTVLQIAMYGYIGDITTNKERTTLMSILNGVGIAIFPIAEFLSGQIFQAGGYYAVYGCSFGFTILGLIYIFFIPETITKRDVNFDDEPEMNLKSICIKANKSIIDGVKCITKPRPHRKILLFTLFIMIFTQLGHQRSNSLLFVQKMFHWTVTDYTNYTSFFVATILVRTFLTTPLYCYALKMHDCILTITGLLVSVAASAVFGTATKGWMMYYGAALTVLGALDSTPLRSMVSKMVDPLEYGKVFTFTATASAISELITSSGFQEIYYQTEDWYPGFMYLVSAGLIAIAIVFVLILYAMIINHERRMKNESDFDQIYTSFSE